MAEERIQKIMAEQGLCSRRAAEQIIAEGRVKVNGHPVKVGDKMDPNRDVLHVDDERIYIQKNQQLYYLALYKPRGYVTTASDDEALGVKIDVPPEKSTELLNKIQICFLFAQNYHIAMKYVGPIRKELGIRTVFNILGPLSNPAGANMELMGVYDQSLVEPLAQVMANLGVVRGMVVYGQDKLDEISMCAATSVCEIKDGKFISYEITPEQFGYERCEKGALTGGTPEENAKITMEILSGADKGPKRQAVCLNAGAAIYIAGKADTIEAGIRKAEQIIDEGLALKKLEQFREESQK